MSNQPTESNGHLSSWNEIRRVADELELQLHLASMDARDRWQVLEPRLTALGQWFERSGERVGEAITKELSAVGSLIMKLHADIKAGKTGN